MALNLESLLLVAVTALVTGGSNALGIWLVSRHLINRLERNGKQHPEVPESSRSTYPAVEVRPR